MGFLRVEIEHSDGSRSVEQIGVDPLADDGVKGQVEAWIEENERIEVLLPQSAGTGDFR